MDTNRFRTWYDEARKSQGSVEKKSIKQTQEANRNGRYIIGNMSGEEDYFVSREATLNDVIHLHVDEGDVDEQGNVCEKKLLLSDIDDLKSRLMLLGSDANSELAESIKYEKEYFLQVSVYVDIRAVADRVLLKEQVRLASESIRFGHIVICLTWVGSG